MKTSMHSQGNREIIMLSRTDLEILIYMTSDVWITPDVKRFKKEILERAGISQTKKGVQSFSKRTSNGRE